MYLHSLHFLKVLTVWELDLNNKSLRIVDNLYGHTEAVTCLAASDTYNIVVSGSRDCTAIVWDLCTKAFVRQLKKHNAPVAALAINNSTVSKIIDYLFIFNFIICFENY